MQNMKLLSSPLLIATLLMLSACEEEIAEADTSEIGGEAAGEVLGGTISDDMIPLEELTSTSPPAVRRPGTTSTTTVTEDEAGTTSVETTVTTTTSEAPSPAPPLPPATPE